MTHARTRSIMLLLAGSIALMMTGFGIILPVFARRLGEFGSGVEMLGLMTMAFALSQFLMAPFMGSLADRFGRKPGILLALFSFAVINLGFLAARNTTTFIILRAAEGALTAGLFPAAMGIVADVSPENQRGRWAGLLMGGYGAGFVFGPVLGGFLYDNWGFGMPFIVSAVMAALALAAAVIVVPETRGREVRKREMLLDRRDSDTAPVVRKSWWQLLPRPLYVFGTLLLIDFALVFSFAFVEPEMIFYFYDELNWSTVGFGIVVGFYGGAFVLGQLLFGSLSDRFARKPVILLGQVLNAMFYIGLVFIESVYLLSIVALISGLGEALVMPALSAFYVDITDKPYRSRILGMKESAAALGGVLGPLLVASISSFTDTRTVFMISVGVITFTLLLTFFVLKPAPKPVGEIDEMDWEVTRRRAAAAQASFTAIIVNASTTRERRNG
jgi:multidrug resistance protein